MWLIESYYVSIDRIQKKKCVHESQEVEVGA